MTMPDAEHDAAARSYSSAGPDGASRDAEEMRRRGVLSPQDALQPERLPPPPAARKRRPGLLAAFSGFLTFLLVGFFIAGFALVSVQRKIREPGPLSADKVLYIAPGTDVPDIITQLETESVISNSLLMNTALLVEGARSKLRAGEYLFKQNASLQDVMDTLVSGRQILHPISIPEGLTTDQIVQRLRDNDVLTGDIRDVPKEGTLLPDTYKVARADTRNNLIRKMQEDQRKLVDQIWSRRSPDLPIKTPYELVTLASIVERETGKADERPHVASVFINRLNKRMRLQSDPTIVYGLVQGRGTLGRGILRSEVDKWTPYNTYQIDGLPPGPIANPGRAALEAVANPSRTSDLYFVADGTGGHVFASTLDEHQRNVVRWRQIEKDARDRGAAEIDKAPAPNMSPTLGTQSPVVPPAARPNTRSDLTPAEEGFGQLSRVGTAANADFAPKLAPDPPPANRLGALPFSSGKMPRTIAGIVEERGRAKPAGRGDERPVIASVTPSTEPKAPMVLSYGPDIEALGIQVRGVQGRSNLLDGPAVEDSDGPSEAGVDLATYPVAPQRRAEQKAIAARLGLPSESDQLPPSSPEPPPASSRADLASGRTHARAFDASEGTPLDPLLKKNWDLSHAQVIPALVTR